jgi:hypothetical protein
MSSHTIALRRAWELSAAGLPPRRIELPGTIPPLDRPARLSRAFHRPPVGPGGVAAWLSLARVDGLGRVRLNGEDLPFALRRGPGALLLLLSALGRRNVLELELDASEHPRPGWGEVGLVLVPRSPGGAGPPGIES